MSRCDLSGWRSDALKIQSVILQIASSSFILKRGGTSTYLQLCVEPLSRHECRGEAQACSAPASTLILLSSFWLNVAGEVGGLLTGVLFSTGVIFMARYNSRARCKVITKWMRDQLTFWGDMCPIPLAERLLFSAENLPGKNSFHDIGDPDRTKNYSCFLRHTQSSIISIQCTARLLISGIYR